MIYGNNNLFSCPQCGKMLKTKTLLSGNTFDATYYSDGKVEYPFYKKFPVITVCPQCNNIFWVRKAAQIEYNDENNSLAEYCRFLTIDEYIKAIKQKVFESNKEEFLLRLFLLWAFNDRVRKEQNLINNNDELISWKENIVKILDLTKNVKDYDILRAELFRYLGQFDKCQEIINSKIEEGTPKLSGIAIRILKECKSKRIELISWNYYDEFFDKIKKERS